MKIYIRVNDAFGGLTCILVENDFYIKKVTWAELIEEKNQTLVLYKEPKFDLDGDFDFIGELEFFRRKKGRKIYYLRFNFTGRIKIKKNE